MDTANCHKLIILGCGAAGMMAGCIAGMFCDDVLILDANNVPGKKLLATGNGRCNFTNIFMSLDRYNRLKNREFTKDNKGIDKEYEDNESFDIMEIIDRFGFEDVLLFFENLGVPVRIINEYCYPYNLEAVSIRDALFERLKELCVKVKLNNRIVRIEKDNDKGIFSLYTDGVYCYQANKVILACAGKAGKSFGCDGSIYSILENLGAKNIVKPLPALCGLTSDNKMLKDISGVRARAKVSLLIDENIFIQENGEIIFSEKGISGIPVMNMSRYAARALDESRKCSISLDFFDDLSKDDLSVMLKKMIFGRKVSLETAFTGILNHKLLDAILKDCGLSDVMTSDENVNILPFIDKIKNFRLDIIDTTGWENAQVTTGGLSLDEIDLETMESRFCKGLYIVGETLDVDGCCGGYNLQWAWSTGAIAGAAATVGKLEKEKILY
ncbi:MAG: aminoacetone oxidase family FAD-binding enzyme [Lachnospiraceae bacterium]|nr:aminoacetone oxidase family FAD-binding enzyme [Lachnospiraceae bacterium]